MLFSDFLQIIAVLIEGVITVIAVLLATRQQKPYGWGIAVTFGLFVLFDVIRIFTLPVPELPMLSASSLPADPCSTRSG